MLPANLNPFQDPIRLAFTFTPQRSEFGGQSFIEIAAMARPVPHGSGEYVFGTETCVVIRLLVRHAHWVNVSGILASDKGADTINKHGLIFA